MADPELDALFARIRNLTQVAQTPPPTQVSNGSGEGTMVSSYSPNPGNYNPNSYLASPGGGISLGFPTETSGPPPLTEFKNTPLLSAPPPLTDFSRNRFALEENRAQQLAARATKNASRAKTVDLCFVVDFTTSMEPWIERVKESMVNVVDAIRKDYLPDAQLRVALVGYRDFDQAFQPHNFAYDFSEPWTLRHILDNTFTEANGDFAEDVLGGLSMVPSLDWQNDTRLLILIGDAPAHGRAFHSLGTKNDRFYDAPDPSGRSGLSDMDVLELLRAIVNKRILFHYFRITPHTAQMEGVFANILTNKFRQKWSVQDLGSDASSFLQHVLATTVSSMRAAGVLRY